MNRLPKLAPAALLLAACCLAGCGAPKAAPATPSLSSEATEMAERFCDDLAAMSYSRAVDRMAVRASEASLSSADQDAVVELAAARCPEDMP